MAVVALIISLIDFGAQLNDFQAQRIRAAEDTCYIIRGIVIQTVPYDKAIASLKKWGLSDCQAFAIHISHVK